MMESHAGQLARVVRMTTGVVDISGAGVEAIKTVLGDRAALLATLERIVDYVPSKPQSHADTLEEITMWALRAIDKAEGRS